MSSHAFQRPPRVEAAGVPPPRHDREFCEKQEPTQEGLTSQLHQRERDWE
jgi:hypothetical protein